MISAMWVWLLIFKIEIGSALVNYNNEAYGLEGKRINNDTGHYMFKIRLLLFEALETKLNRAEYDPIYPSLYEGKSTNQQSRQVSLNVFTTTLNEKLN